MATTRKGSLWHVRSEAEWRRRLVRWWYGPNANPGSKQALNDERWHQQLEIASQAGWPDIFWTNSADRASGWIELKYVDESREGQRVTLGLRPAQAPTLRWLAARGQRAGILAYVADVQQWLWVPAQATHRWALNVSGPNGFLLWPHTWGIGAVPKPWDLPVDARTHPVSLDRRSQVVHYMVDGHEVSPQAFDASSPYAQSFAAVRKRDAVAEQVITQARARGQKSRAMKHLHEQKRHKEQSHG